jgi:hypothetical protein
VAAIWAVALACGVPFYLAYQPYPEFYVYTQREGDSPPAVHELWTCTDHYDLGDQERSEWLRKMFVLFS